MYDIKYLDEGFLSYDILYTPYQHITIMRISYFNLSYLSHYPSDFDHDSFHSTVISSSRCVVSQSQRFERCERFKRSLIFRLT